MFVGEFAVWSVYIYQLYDKKRYRQLTDAAPPSAVNQLDASTVVDQIDSQIHKVQDDLPELKGWKSLLFWIPTMCDLTATTVSWY